jgi:hypothetical protein
MVVVVVVVVVLVVVDVPIRGVAWGRGGKEQPERR